MSRKYHRGPDGILRYSDVPGHPAGWGWFPAGVGVPPDQCGGTEGVDDGRALGALYRLAKRHGRRLSASEVEWDGMTLRVTSGENPQLIDLEYLGPADSVWCVWVGGHCALAYVPDPHDSDAPGEYALALL